jgi:hypothetical protein
MKRRLESYKKIRKVWVINPQTKIKKNQKKQILAKKQQKELKKEMEEE